MAKAIASKNEGAALERQAKELDACFDAMRRVMMKSNAPPPTDVELSPQDWRALPTLADHGRMTMTDLSEALGMPLSTATRLVERLITKGLVIRSGIKDDRRVVRVELSAEGNAMQKAFLGKRLEMSRSMLTPLSPGEREIFIELMRKITQPQASEQE
jgi:DNA-binding MarR family transcriptional regulator